MYQLAFLLLLISHVPLSAGCGQSSTGKVAPEDEARLKETWAKLNQYKAQNASQELWNYLSKRRSQNIFTKKAHDEYIQRISFWIDRGGKIGEGRIACLIRGKKINDAVLKMLRNANQKMAS